jgi:glucan phosphorylase
MKVLPNGGVNLSELDGWWAEAYQPDVGWALGDGKEHGDDPAWDAAEARQFTTSSSVRSSRASMIAATTVCRASGLR